MILHVILVFLYFSGNMPSEITKTWKAEGHLATASSLYRTGVELHNQGNYGDALSYLKKALKIRERVLGDHVTTAETHYAIGKLIRIFPYYQVLSI